MVLSMGKRLAEGTAGAGISAVAESSSHHPCDWGRALASAVSHVVEEVIDTTGIDPCREPGGLDLVLHVDDVPGGAAITVTWLPTPANTGAAPFLQDTEEVKTDT